jgi:hypothetical protein
LSNKTKTSIKVTRITITIRSQIRPRKRDGIDVTSYIEDALHNKISENVHELLEDNDDFEDEVLEEVKQQSDVKAERIGDLGDVDVKIRDIEMSDGDLGEEEWREYFEERGVPWLQKK